MNCYYVNRATYPVCPHHLPICPYLPCGMPPRPSIILCVTEGIRRPYALCHLLLLAQSESAGAAAALAVTDEGIPPRS